MPCGKVHDRITLAAALVAGPVWWYFTPPPVDPTIGLTLVAATLFSGLMLSPDLDLDSSVYHRWGPLRWLWLPYQKLIPHRSRLSHSFFLAPALRVVYFIALTWLVLRAGTYVAAQFVAFNRNAISREATDLFVAFWHRHPHHFVMALLGIFLGSALHCGADFACTDFKRHRPPALLRPRSRSRRRAR